MQSSKKSSMNGGIVAEAKTPSALNTDEEMRRLSMQKHKNAKSNLPVYPHHHQQSGKLSSSSGFKAARLVGGGAGGMAQQ